jgi:hypothetical protein
LARGRNHFGDEVFRLVAAQNPFGAATSPLGAQSKFGYCQLKHLGYGFADSLRRERHSMSTNKEQPQGESGDTPRAVQTVLDALEKLKFGAIQLTVHEGRLVQVDVTERHRYPN